MGDPLNTDPQNLARACYRLLLDRRGVAMHPAQATAEIENAPVAHMLAEQFLDGGEAVILLLRPSRWSVLFSALPWIAGGTLAAAIVLAFDGPTAQRLLWVQLIAMLVGVRVMWSMLQWTGRFYVLTDRRVIVLWGVFRNHSWECPLCDVARTTRWANFRDRIFRLGNIQVVPDEKTTLPAAWWQSLRRVDDVHHQIDTAIRRAKTRGE